MILELRDYVDETLFTTLTAEAVPRKGEEIILDPDDDYWRYAFEIRWEKERRGTEVHLRPVVYLMKRAKPQNENPDEEDSEAG